MIAKLGGFESLIQKLNPEDCDFFIKGYCTLASLIRGIDSKFVKITIPIFCSALQKNTDLKILSYGMLALYSITEKNSLIKEVISSGVVQVIVKNLGYNFPFYYWLIIYLRHSELNIFLWSFRSLQNILQLSTEEEINVFTFFFFNIFSKEVLNNPEFLPTLIDLLSHSKKEVRQETCLCLSYITGRNKKQIQTIINYPQCIQKLIEMARKDRSAVKY